jgi:DNA-binding NtrC family response regulator
MSDAGRKFELLIVDDEPQMRSLLERIFTAEGYGVRVAASGPEALALMGAARTDAAMIDLVMPEMDGLTLLDRMLVLEPGIRIIMMTGHGGVEEAVAAIRSGAIDFIKKPFLPEEARSRMAQLYRAWELEEENRRLKLEIQRRFGFHRLVGNSTSILKLKEMITRIGPTDATILIQGETGSGKELVAKAIHYHSERAQNQFVPVDCAAISETVIESELFGHEKGAFTGAHVSTLGLLRAADNGTLFLDEIGNLSTSIQMRLLRVIQEREVRPIGSTKAFPVNVRVLAATNLNLAEEVAAGNFREDLFFRLNVLSISVPPLRDRTEDVPLLAKHFLKRFASEYSPVRNISDATLRMMENYRWPGNVRELENAIRRAIALGRSETIMPEDLPSTVRARSAYRATPGGLPTGDTLMDYEILAIQNALKKCNHNRTKAAKLLKIGEATLYRKLKKYKIGGPNKAGAHSS